jgi:hypothetical protein
VPTARQRQKPVADQCSRNSPSTGLISAGLIRRECATVAECKDTFERFLPQNNRLPDSELAVSLEECQKHTKLKKERLLSSCNP